jgi:hypothetical protein
VTGRLFQPRDAMGLSEILRTLVEDAPLRRRLAAAGEQRMRESFSIRKSADRMTGIYTSLIASD